VLTFGVILYSEAICLKKIEPSLMQCACLSWSQHPGGSTSCPATVDENRDGTMRSSWGSNSVSRSWARQLAQAIVRLLAAMPSISGFIDAAIL
jgi:hypothetical protein